MGLFLNELSIRFLDMKLEIEIEKFVMSAPFVGGLGQQTLNSIPPSQPLPEMLSDLKRLQRKLSTENAKAETTR